MVVKRESQVLLVDAEAKRVRGDDQLELVGHEAVLGLLAVGSRHLPVVEPYGVVLLEALVQLLRFAHRRDVDNADTRRVVDDLVQRLILHGVVHCATSRSEGGAGKPVIVVCGFRCRAGSQCLTHLSVPSP